jgi:hypothetical protein
MNYANAYVRAEEGEMIKRKGWVNQFAFIPLTEIGIEDVSKINTFPPKIVSVLAAIKKEIKISQQLCVFKNWKIQNGVQPSAEDMNAEDWEVVEMEVTFPTVCQLNPTTIS